ncbi:MULTISPECIES: hypothetical protein [Auritidibacter]|uniref:Uncharacterized protein n=1 Tax=Auritidibacter ignavus TaxID=678932 RepID=A0AAJ6AFJ7_9MICC|nr:MULTISPECIES: hypothetical protein [Auritidibacter]AXR74354.1 hypothetical protein DCC27_008685 [Auritidibacter sp. NML130574]NIH72597.1 hypothetical protein [Auritidibacter ignavus]PXA75161.1 hypothetical protein DCC24_11865 [Auritidibacter sp. NML100628]RMX21492.1 hypothetical protein DYI20_11720 [Auritidibacter ignavus]WGH80848.1 hypothetical protein QDX25_08575 [Auritidibacter ignavus]
MTTNIGADTSSVRIKEWQTQARQFINTQKYIEVLPAAPEENPWAPASLNRMEVAFLESWGNRPNDLSSEMRTYYEWFLGEGLVRLFGGTWVYLPGHLINAKETEGGYGVQYDGAEHIDVVTSLLPMALDVSQGSWWSATFRITAQQLERDYPDP